MAKSKRGPKLTKTTAQSAYSGGLFQGLSDVERRCLLDNAGVSEHPTKSWLYHQGDFSQNLFFVQSGLVKLTQVMPEGDEVLVRLIGPGEVFGYFSLALKRPSITSAQTVQMTKLMRWKRELALELLQSIPRATFNLFKLSVRDAVYFHERASRLQTQPVSQRVEWAVAEVAQTFGAQNREEIVISNGLGQREIADLAGTTIFTVSRELSRLEREGVIRKERGRIVVRQIRKLRP